ncbi:hypothetical protein DIS24_g1703 [Lasiodiplodia hormozganensis]|uniref:Aflatoxin regulatory protein domain-containing protein n=1 Tax=Lasiodiplodia hormozganensis TaxID=869390 RepID=A0AA39Z3I1_9PEZI|nr:hypothetical protein DIS24_g1703 [Lasiodiplodia hormozganensis]
MPLGRTPKYKNRLKPYPSPEDLKSSPPSDSLSPSSSERSSSRSPSRRDRENTVASIATAVFEDFSFTSPETVLDVGPPTPPQYDPTTAVFIEPNLSELCLEWCSGPEIIPSAIAEVNSPLLQQHGDGSVTMQLPTGEARLFGDEMGRGSSNNDDDENNSNSSRSSNSSKQQQQQQRKHQHSPCNCFEVVSCTMRNLQQCPVEGTGLDQMLHLGRSMLSAITDDFLACSGPHSTSLLLFIYTCLLQLLATYSETWYSGCGSLIRFGTFVIDGEDEYALKQKVILLEIRKVALVVDRLAGLNGRGQGDFMEAGRASDGTHEDSTLSYMRGFVKDEACRVSRKIEQDKEKQHRSAASQAWF